MTTVHVLYSPKKTIFEVFGLFGLAICKLYAITNMVVITTVKFQLGETSQFGQVVSSLLSQSRAAYSRISGGTIL